MDCVFRAAIKEIVDRRGSLFGDEIVKELTKKGIKTTAKKVGQFARYNMHRKDLIIERVTIHPHSVPHNLYRRLQRDV